MRKHAREWVERYPSIAKVHEAIAGPRRMGSPGIVTIYVYGVRSFVKFLGFKDPEVALQKMKSGEVNATAVMDSYIDYALKQQAHKTVLSQSFGIKKWLELNEVKVNWKKIEFPTGTVTQED